MGRQTIFSNSNSKRSIFTVFNISFFNQTYKCCRKKFSYPDLQKSQIHDTWKTLTLLLCCDLVVVGVWSKNFWVILPKIVIWCVMLLCYTQHTEYDMPTTCYVLFLCYVLVGNAFGVYEKLNNGSSSIFVQLVFFKPKRLWNGFVHLCKPKDLFIWL